jgi:hypothetical protein
MSDTRPSVVFSAVSLRLAGTVGQVTLDRVAAGDARARAELDQHKAAVRTSIGDCLPDPEPRTAAVAARAERDAKVRAARPDVSELRAAAFVRCPDVPFVSDARSAAEPVPMTLLLHYICRFLEAAVAADWRPARSLPASRIDWESMRLAALCELITEAEAAAGLHPGLQRMA